MESKLREFIVMGRKKPSETEKNPKVYKMSIYAPNKSVAKSRFWYFMGNEIKMKRASGEILFVSELYEKKPLKVKNFGIWLRYNSRTGTHNMYKEYRDVTSKGAVFQLYQDMASKHRARFSSIHVIRVAVVKAADCKREAITQMHSTKLRFPLPRRRLMRPAKHRVPFHSSRPHVI
uniref:60S ribosomal protein L18a n=1 Tax=Stygiella incarcerata TaxID=1712417 RepID=A0A192ZHK8_9EUKA|nr:60S ribosomal protein L18a-2 [Stygiella incarcerata]